MYVYVCIYIYINPESMALRFTMIFFGFRMTFLMSAWVLKKPSIGHGLSESDHSENIYIYIYII